MTTKQDVISAILDYAFASHERGLNVTNEDWEQKITKEKEMRNKVINALDEFEKTLLNKESNHDA